MYESLIFLIFLFIFCYFASAQNGVVIEQEFVKKGCNSTCIYREDRISSKTISNFPKNCSTLCGYFVIDDLTDLSEKQLISLFENAKILIGGLTIFDTNYTTGSFLSGLEAIDCMYDSGVEWVSNMKMTELGLTNLKNISCNDFTISDNSKMTKLNMPKFENYQGTNNLVISRLASDFCMSGDEIKGFLTTTTVPATVEISGKLCDFVKNDKSCTKDVSDGCTDFYGGLTIGPNFSDLEKLKSLETFIGTLFLNATNFIDLSIFEKLHYIIQIDQKKSALKVEGNEMLNSALFPSLKRIFSTSPLESVIFKNNHENLKNDPMTCYKIRNSVMPSSLWVPDFDDISCEDMKVVNTPAPETPGVTQVLGNPTVTPPPGHSETCTDNSGGNIWNSKPILLISLFSCIF
ncbi:Protein CBG01135 [Caenorhabditis briggsae]|uniref:Protein CBG01135 n=1 Tax=Caenorhabditis briggsae TaxID=6238 RepID=A8WPM9_CAEBR|nr:Protein CBG01135 [Caenorhabditis briggsae]CAP22436.1 Protein CBG01135 [Caenorhabditis briggsae]